MFSNSLYTKDEFSIAAIAVCEQEKCTLQEMVKRRHNNLIVGRCYKTENTHAEFILLYPIEINSDDPETFLSKIKELFQNLEDLKQHVFIPILIDGKNYELMEFFPQKNKDTKGAIYHKFDADLGSFSRYFVNDDDNLLDSASSVMSDRGIITNEDTGAVVIDIMESIISKGRKETPKPLKNSWNLRKAHQEAYNKKAKAAAEALPWYMEIANFSLQTGTIGAGIGLIVGSVVPVIGTLAGAAVGGAIGTLIGAAYGAIYSPLSSSVIATSIADVDGFDEVNLDTDYGQQNKKSWYRLSRTRAFTSDARFFMGAASGGLMGGAIGAILGTFIFPGIGTAVGAGIGAGLGALVGASATYVHPYLAAKTAPTPDIKVPITRAWEQESSYDVPWYARLFTGGSFGLLLGGALGTIVAPGIGTVIGGAVGTLVVGGLAVASPALFAATRRFLGGKNRNEKNLLNGENTTPSLKKPTQAWYKQSLFDMPWYVRGFAGGSGGLILGAAIGTIVPGFGTAIGGFIGAALGTTAALASPMLFAAGKKIADKIKEKISYSEDKAAPKATGMDIPWYLRLFAGAAGGAAMGTALGTVVPGVGNIIGAAVGAIAGATAAMASPAAFAFFHSLFKPKPTAPGPAGIPWYVRVAAGALTGAAIGTALGTVVPGIGNVLGGVIGTLVGASVGLLAPLVTPLFAVPKPKPSSNLLKADSSSDDDEEEEEEGLEMKSIPPPPSGGNRNEKIKYRPLLKEPNRGGGSGSGNEEEKNDLGKKNDRGLKIN